MPSYMYAPHFEPIVRVGENAAFLPRASSQRSNSSEPTIARAISVMPLPPILVDFGSISATEKLSDKAPNDAAASPKNALEMPENYFAHYRFVPLDAIEVLLKQPQAKPAYNTKQNTNRLDAFAAQLPGGFGFGELIQYEDVTARFDVWNESDRTIPASRVLFWGYSVAFQKLTVTDVVRELANKKNPRAAEYAELVTGGAAVALDRIVADGQLPVAWVATEVTQ